MSNSLVPHNDYQIIDQVDYRTIDKEQVHNSRFGRFIFLGLFVVFGFIGSSAYWAVTAKLDGAVVAPASFVVEGNRKTVQHLEGGIVSELLVTEGDFVRANQVLMRMDSTDNDVNLDVLGSQIAELQVRKARLLAEFEGSGKFTISSLTAHLSGEVGNQKLQSIYLTQKQLFDAQTKARDSEKRVLEQQIASLEQEIDGIEEQRGANSRQMDIAVTELDAFETLLAKGLTQVSRVNSVKREIERLRGLDASFTTSQARSLNQIGELRLTAIGQQKLRQEAITTELASIEGQISSIEPQYLGAVQKQTRIDIKAPVSGRVVNMSIYTKGGVIRSGEPILDIVPADEELIIEAKVNTSDIEKLRIGQTTRIRLSAFDQSDVPEANGQIIDLSADSIKDERTGGDYYVARVKLSKEQPVNVQKLEFVPGMPADVFVNTGERTALSYLMQPLNDRLAKTFIE